MVILFHNLGGDEGIGPVRLNFLEALGAGGSALLLRPCFGDALPSKSCSGESFVLFLGF